MSRRQARAPQDKGARGAGSGERTPAGSPPKGACRATDRRRSPVRLVADDRTPHSVSPRGAPPAGEPAVGRASHRPLGAGPADTYRVTTPLKQHQSSAWQTRTNDVHHGQGSHCPRANPRQTRWKRSNPAQRQRGHAHAEMRQPAPKRPSRATAREPTPDSAGRPVREKRWGAFNPFESKRKGCPTNPETRKTEAAKHPIQSALLGKSDRRRPPRNTWPSRRDGSSGATRGRRCARSATPHRRAPGAGRHTGRRR
jgi:hypothetical protein